MKNRQLISSGLPADSAKPFENTGFGQYIQGFLQYPCHNMS